MPFQPAGSGQANVAEYMMSGLPYVTASSVTSGSVYAIQFPYLTIDFSLKNTGANSIAFGFTLSGTLGSNRVTLVPSASFNANFRIKTLYVMGFDGSSTYECVAGLTTVGTRDFPTLTGSAPAAVSGVLGVDPYFSYNGLG